MIRPEPAKWGDSAESLLRRAIESRHARTRERFLAVHRIALGDSATTVAAEINRRAHTVLRWVHAYNAEGPNALTYRRTGGSRALFSLDEPESLVPLIDALGDTSDGEPESAQGDAPAQFPRERRITTRQIAVAVAEQIGRRVSRETVRRALHSMELTWKKNEEDTWQSKC